MEQSSNLMRDGSKRYVSWISSYSSFIAINQQFHGVMFTNLAMYKMWHGVDLNWSTVIFFCIFAILSHPEKAKVSQYDWKTATVIQGKQVLFIGSACKDVAIISVQSRSFSPNPCPHAPLVEDHWKRKWLVTIWVLYIHCQSHSSYIILYNIIT